MTVYPADESKMMVRMSDFISEPNQMLPPILDYEKQPLVSLEQAVKPLLLLVPNVEEMVWTVKQNCQCPSDDLSSDESASIMLYTLEWLPRQSSFYFILNETLRSKDRQKLSPWFLFLRLFMFALAKLPSKKHRMIYRGIKINVGEEFPEGKTFIWWAFSSCTSSMQVLERFLAPHDNRIIFNIECDSAKDISQHSFHKCENEMLLYPARQFQVISSFNSGSQLRIIHVKEMQPFSPLIHIPSLSSLLDNHYIGRIKRFLTIARIPQISSTKLTCENQQLQQLIEQCKNQSQVNLKEQNLTDEDMEIVVKEAIINKQCKELDLSKNKITSVGAEIIAEALNKNTTLEMVYLRGNPICDNGVCSIAKTLSLNNCMINILDLQSTGITDEGIRYIAVLLLTNSRLRRLLLSNNEITDIGIQRLANVLIHHNNTLISLRINGNKMISDSSIDVLVTLLKYNQRLECLNIKTCSLSEEGKESLRQIVPTRKSFKLDM